MGNRLALLVLIMIGGRLVGNRLVVTGARLPAAPSVLGRCLTTLNKNGSAAHLASKADARVLADVVDPAAPLPLVTADLSLS
jgi:hypothetical protein